jgi:hypothetical protein
MIWGLKCISFQFSGATLARPELDFARPSQALLIQPPYYWEHSMPFRLAVPEVELLILRNQSTMPDVYAEESAHGLVFCQPFRFILHAVFIC